MSKTKNTRAPIAPAALWADFWDLPFVSNDANPRHKHWNLPAAGGYCGGNWAGEAAAQAYLVHMQNGEGSGYGTLQLIALAFADRMSNAESEDERDSLRGQIVGFFATVGQAAHGFAQHMMRATPWTTDDIQNRIDNSPALADAYMRDYEKKWRSKAAKAGWATRRKTAGKTKRAA